MIFASISKGSTQARKQSSSVNGPTTRLRHAWGLISGSVKAPRTKRSASVPRYRTATQAAPDAVWDRFRGYADDLAASGKGTVGFAAPFLPTIVGTDTYTDELW